MPHYNWKWQRRFQVFNPTYYFPNLSQFLTTFGTPIIQHSITAAAQTIPTFCTSSALKISNAEGHLQNILSISEWEFPSLPQYSAPSGNTGSTIATSGRGFTATSSASFTLPPITAKSQSVLQNLDDFFSNVFSALDVFAQIVNLVYLHHPMATRDVSLQSVVREINSMAVQPDSIGTLLSGFLNSPLHTDMNKYRHTTTHVNSLYFRVHTEVDPFSLVLTPPKIVAILLADNPRATPLTFSDRRDFRIFGAQVFRETKDIINAAYGIMEATIGATGQIPV